ncbi:MAG: stage III sporulation protein AA [Dethiobacter sp.]|nr:stage III sporulation protein AA [Dethiobacter sp.]
MVYEVRTLAEIYWKKQILPYLPSALRAVLDEQCCGGGLEEIRLRVGQPLFVHNGEGEVLPCLGGCGPYYVTSLDIQSVLLRMTEHSLYARDEELRRGYLSLPGGHRVGFAGRTVLENGAVKLLRDISGINIRVAHEIKGAGQKILPRIYCAAEKTVRHTLIVSPPQAGKTTLLRDLARMLSSGDSATGRPGLKVGIVDERSEIAGCYAGVPQLDVGMRSDVLDGCPKAEGMMMLVRSMSPQVVVTDELGRPEDIRAVEEVISSGAAVLATAHGRTVEELLKRPSLAGLFTRNLFELVVVLSRRKGPGTVEAVYRGEDIIKIAKDRGWAHAG